MTYTLAVERSSLPGSWALYGNAKLLIARSFEVGGLRAPGWVAELRVGLDGLAVFPANIQNLVVGTGPGSFSGIRATIAALQGMALPHGRPVFGISSAAVLARQVAHQTGAHTIAVVGDARRQRLWCAVFRIQPDKTLTLAATGRKPSQSSDDFALTDWEHLRAKIPHEARVVSPDWERLVAGLTRTFDDDTLLSFPVVPTADELGALFLADSQAARRAPMPVYLHPAVA